ncbi:MAG: hypothetical protein K5770_15825 [Lachnospiraceae bacterium]|nr:hypothetical protein [Lachnospiraceae bacterium]
MQDIAAAMFEQNLENRLYMEIDEPYERLDDFYEGIKNYFDIEVADGSERLKKKSFVDENPLQWAQVLRFFGFNCPEGYDICVEDEYSDYGDIDVQEEEGFIRTLEGYINGDPIAIDDIFIGMRVINALYAAFCKVEIPEDMDGY